MYRMTEIMQESCQTTCQHSLSRLNNPIVTLEQLSVSRSKQKGLSQDLENAVKYHASCVLQALGVLLRLPQIIIAEAIVIFWRFWVGAGGGSLLEHSAKDVFVASLFIVTKTGAHPVTPRQLLSSLQYVLQNWSGQYVASKSASIPLYTEGTYQSDRIALLKTEAVVLQALGFQTYVATPHLLCINYLNALSILQNDEDQASRSQLVQKAFTHLNAGLLSPQMIYLTSQPNALAVAALYLAARELSISMPDGQWWEVFDIEREELGFLVVAFLSMKEFAEEQARIWGREGPPLDCQALRDLVKQDTARNT